MKKIPTHALTEPPMTKKPAFTLIELLVVLALIMLTVVFGVPAFNKYGDRAEVSSTAEQIQATIEKAYANSNTPPKGANVIDVWLMSGGSDTSSSDKTSGQVVFTRGRYDKLIAPGSVVLTTPNDPSIDNGFSSESVRIPDYMHLNNVPGIHFGHSLLCNFIVAGSLTCSDSNASSAADKDMGNSFDLILTSDKTTDLKYRISIYLNPFKVRTSAEK